jgi:4-alpha-glucanotransferase
MRTASSRTSFPCDLRRRSSGILLHVTSLPGPHGSGDLGPEAHRFIDFLAAAGQSWWQVLPVGPPGPAPACSPYDSSSAFALSPWLVSLDGLRRQALLAPRDLQPVAGLSPNRVKFPAALRFREARLRRAFAAFAAQRGEEGKSFRDFREASRDWLEDFALFAALRSHAGGKRWTEWDSGVRRREPSALRAARRQLSQEVAFHRFVQFELDTQWKSLREHAHRRGIGLIGDVPIFVAHESADVWSHPELFQLDRRGERRRVSGYPPDVFNTDGQLWGHPQYDWAVHERTGFAWWVRRFARTFELFDAVRIDHFLGFTRTWSVPGGAPNARGGKWVASPGDKLLAAVERQLGRRAMIAEDLGHVTPADRQLREKHGLATTRILQFGFGSDADSADHLPHSYPPLCAAYPGNHDCNTTAGWFRDLSPARRQRVLSYLGSRAAEVHLGAIRALMASPASLVIIPMQDVLGLDRRSRMNTPGTVGGNWEWRLHRTDLGAPARQLRLLADVFCRNQRQGKDAAR